MCASWAVSAFSAPEAAEAEKAGCDYVVAQGRGGATCGVARVSMICWRRCFQPCAIQWSLRAGSRRLRELPQSSGRERMQYGSAPASSPRRSRVRIPTTSGWCPKERVAGNRTAIPRRRPRPWQHGDVRGYGCRRSQAQPAGGRGCRRPRPAALKRAASINWPNCQTIAAQLLPVADARKPSEVRGGAGVCWPRQGPLGALRAPRASPIRRRPAPQPPWPGCATRRWR
jgi:hypothetical protein